MPDIVSAVRMLEDMGLLIREPRILSWKFEAAKAMEKADSLGKAIMLRSDCCDGIDIVSNIIPSREVLRRYLGVQSDEEMYAKLFEAMNNPLKCGEDSFKDHYVEDQRTLENLPALLFFEEDAGRSFTASIHVVRDPEREIYDASVQRIVPKDKMAGIVTFGGHVRRIIDGAYRSKGKEAPVAVCFSPHPVVFLGGALQPRFGVFEMDVVNRLLGGELKLCRTPLYDLPVPCECSHVLEGRVTFEDVEIGPFGDVFLTYYTERRASVVIYDKIYRSRIDRPFHVAFVGGTEHTIVGGVNSEALIYHFVSRVVRRVHKVRLTKASGRRTHAIISIEKGSDGESKNAILAAFAAQPSLKIVTVVDSDIDIDNPEEVEWAVVTRLQPSRGIVIIRDTQLHILDPASPGGFGDKLGIDATVPIKERHKYRRAKIPSP